MNSHSSVWGRSARAAALVFALAPVGAAVAADQTPPPRVAVAEPGGCATCAGAGSPVAGCTTCGKSKLFGHKPCKPYVPQLCPGACFGYFQTQWHRWEEVCPIPYQGAGLTDAPQRPVPPVSAPAPALLPRPATDPKTADPKAKGTELPLGKPLPADPGTLPKGSSSVPPKMPTIPATLPASGGVVIPLPPTR